MTFRKFSSENDYSVAEIRYNGLQLRAVQVGSGDVCWWANKMYSKSKGKDARTTYQTHLLSYEVPPSLLSHPNHYD